jgi:hypothetical protein
MEFESNSEDCNCPFCTYTPLEKGKIYRCKKGAIMGTFNGMKESIESHTKIFKAVINDDFANEKAEREIDKQINQSLCEHEYIEGYQCKHCIKCGNVITKAYGI